MPTPVENLLSWLADRMLPLGVAARELLTQGPVADRRPWYTPAVTGCVTNEGGWTARQLAFGAEHMPADPAVGAALKSLYISAMTSRTPLRSALAGASGGFSAWPASRAYIIPYLHELETHALALQLAVAVHDFTGAPQVARDNTFLARSSTHAYGVLAGRPIGARFKTPTVSTEDLQSLLRSPRAITIDTIRYPVLALRHAYDRVQAELEEPELVRDVISVLGLLTARSDWYCKIDREIADNDRLEDRLMNLIEESWALSRRRREDPNPTTLEQRLAKWHQEVRTLDEALAYLDDPALSGYARLNLVYSTIVPAVWGKATFEKRITSRPMHSVRMDAEMVARIRAALEASRASTQTRINRRNPHV